MKRLTRTLSAVLILSMALSLTGCGKKGITPKAIRSIAKDADAIEYDDLDEFTDLMKDMKNEKQSAIEELENGVVVTVSGKDIKKLLNESASMSGTDNIIYKKSMEEMSYYFVGDVSTGKQASLLCMISVAFDDDDDASDYYDYQVDSLEKITKQSGSAAEYFDIDGDERTEGGMDYYVVEYKIKKEYESLLGSNSMTMYAGVYIDGSYVMYYLSMDIGSSTDCVDKLDEACKTLGISSPLEIFG